MTREAPLEAWVTGIISVGTLAAAVVLAVGILVESVVLAWIGLLLLLLTPTAQVAVAAGAFVRQREARYLAVSLAALTVLLAALAVAVVLGR